jgi:hypothetical protein
MWPSPSVTDWISALGSVVTAAAAGYGALQPFLKKPCRFIFLV